jgi:ribosome-associated heat shock protein Hsp15
LTENSSTIRLDKWLWFVRVVKTRSIAQELAASGHVRINSVRVVNVAKAVYIGDILTIALFSRVLVLKVVGVPERRGSATEAQKHYEELG